MTSVTIFPGLVLTVDEHGAGLVDYDNGKVVAATSGSSAEYIPKHYKLVLNSDRTVNFAQSVHGLAAGGVPVLLAIAITAARSSIATLPDVAVSISECIVSDGSAPLAVALDADEKKRDAQVRAAGTVVNNAYNLLGASAVSCALTGHNYMPESNLQVKLAELDSMDGAMVAAGWSAHTAAVRHHLPHVFSLVWKMRIAINPPDALLKKVHGLIAKHLPANLAGTALASGLAALCRIVVNCLSLGDADRQIAHVEATRAHADAKEPAARAETLSVVRRYAEEMQARRAVIAGLRSVSTRCDAILECVAADPLNWNSMYKGSRTRNNLKHVEALTHAAAVSLGIAHGMGLKEDSTAKSATVKSAATKHSAEFKAGKQWADSLMKNAVSGNDLVIMFRLDEFAGLAAHQAAREGPDDVPEDQRILPTANGGVRIGAAAEFRGRDANRRRGAPGAGKAKEKEGKRGAVRGRPVEGGLRADADAFQPEEPVRAEDPLGAGRDEDEQDGSDADV